MQVFSHRSTVVAGFMMVVVLVITGCGGGDGDNERATISGQITLPPNPPALGGGGVAVANTQFEVIDFEQRNPNNPNGSGFQTIGSGTTDPTGKYVVTTPQTSSAAVIANGTQPGGPQQGKVVPISGLVNLQANVSKDFDGPTTIACFAGLRAIAGLGDSSLGSITPQQLDAQRISNLERAAAGFVATTDFSDVNSIIVAADTVRRQTNNGAR